MNPSGKYTSHDLSDAYDTGYNDCVEDHVAYLKLQIEELEAKLKAFEEMHNDRDRSTVLRLQ